METLNEISKIEKAFSDFLTTSQLDAIKLIIRKGFWGDAGNIFNDGKNYCAYGYTTNMGKGRGWSGKLSGISKSIDKSSTNLIIMEPDYWGDGSGDMMFFNIELINSKTLESWAKS